MAEPWQARRPQHDTVEGWMPPVNIYLLCESVSVWGMARRQQLLWGFICGVTRQPVIYEHLELLFKHTALSHAKHSPRPEQEEEEWPRDDQTRPHTVSSPSPRPESKGTHTLGTLDQRGRCVYKDGSESGWEQQCDFTLTQIICWELFMRLVNRARG